ncbi:MAG: C39 family peptidase [Patescibacteria group bacterium]
MKKWLLLKLFNLPKAALMVVLLLTTYLLISIPPFAGAQSCGNLEDCNKLIEELTGKLTTIQGQANTLSNQIKQFDTQIKLTEAKIIQTEETINMLGGRIDQLEVSLGSLTKAFSSRAVETYKMARFGDNFAFVAQADDLSGAVSRQYYLKKIQESDRDLMDRLQKAQNSYKIQKTESEQLQEKLEDQKKALAAQKAAKNSLLVATKNDEKKYQQLLSEAKAQLSAFKRFTTGQGGASILTNQTKCDSWGCYYNQRDAQWGNIGMGGSQYTVAEYGCLITSISMVASHIGKNIKPGDIAVQANTFVPGTGYLYHSFSVNGVNVTINTASKSQLDSELAAGRPAIVGLYTGPDHFIVILRKEGDKYVMYDPFLENGGEGTKYLNDKYSVSAINSLRLVQFN